MLPVQHEFVLRNAVLVLLFSLIAPHWWLDLMPLLASSFSAFPLIEWLLDPSPIGMSRVLMIESWIWSLLVCACLALPFGVLIRLHPLENASYLAVFGTVHLGLLIYVQHLPDASINWNFIAAEVGSFFVWIWFGSLLGYAIRHRYQRRKALRQRLHPKLDTRGLARHD
jgi:hypothetical protein